MAEPHALLGIEAHGRLVDDQQPRVVEQRLRDADALAHAAGETAEAAGPRLGEVDQLEQFVDARRARPRGRPLTAAEVREELARAQMRIDAEVLRQVAERRAQRVRVARRCRRRSSSRGPSVGLVRVARMRISVDLPAPLGPSSPRTPGPSVRLTPSTAVCPPGVLKS